MGMVIRGDSFPFGGLIPARKQENEQPRARQTQPSGITASRKSPRIAALLRQKRQLLARRQELMNVTKQEEKGAAAEELKWLRVMLETIEQAILSETRAEAKRAEEKALEARAEKKENG